MITCRKTHFFGEHTSLKDKSVVKLEDYLKRGKCFICGNIVEFQAEKDYSLREAKCPICGGGKRNRDLALAIIKTYLHDDTLSLAESIPNMKNISIYEAAASGPIHEQLKKLPNYQCAEYLDNVPFGSLNKDGIRCENLERLTYPDRSFDLVITQDVFEHVYDHEKGFLEVYRVLKPCGYHIFTIPFHEGRGTITRVTVKQGKRSFLLPPVYHGDPLRDGGSLVCTDFGEDILDYLKSLGLPTEIAVHENFYSPDMVPHIHDERSYEKYLKFKDPSQMLKYFLYNSVVFRSKKPERSDTLPADGERFLPWMEDPIINYEHLHRHGFAKEFVKGKIVLDLACGEGYGSDMLAEEAAKVIGVDIDETTIDHARNKYVKSNLKFIKSSITSLVIKGKKLFDVIICFEALEHIEEQDKVMAEVKRLLKDDGIFIISMPNKYVYSDCSNIKNPWHKKELYFDEFETLLKATFDNVLIYGQKVFPTSNIFPMFEDATNIQELAIEKTASKFSFVSLAKRQARYFIAVASNHLMKGIIGSSYLIDTSETLFRKNAALENVRNKPGAIHNSRGWKLAKAFYQLFFDWNRFKQSVKRDFYLWRRGGFRAVFPKSARGGKPEGKQVTVMPESALAHKYCIGKGLEIGGSAHNPFGLNTLNVDFTDSMDTEFKKEDIRLCGKALGVDIVACGDDVPLPDESQDFIVSSHVIEHFPNPIRALIEWDRLVKPGGIIFMIVPHKNRTFDKGKKCTWLQHLIDDYQDNTTEPHPNPVGHDHCWVTETFVELINYMIRELRMKWELVEVQDVDDKVGNGFTVVIRKMETRDPLTVA